MFHSRMTDHVASHHAVNGDTDNPVAMKNIHVRRLTGLNTVGHNVWSRRSGVGNWWMRIEVTAGVLFPVVEDADDLSRFYHEAPVIVREEGTLTEEVVCVRATSLFA